MERNSGVGVSFNGNSLSHLSPATFQTSPSSISHRRAVEDTELSIFDAERYFKEDAQDAVKAATLLNGTLTYSDLSTNTRASSVSSADGYDRSAGTGQLYYSTPTASSEASWNSRSGLLSNPPGYAAVTMKDTRNVPPSPRRRRFFGRRCPCIGKKSVDVELRSTAPSSLESKSSLSATRRSFRSEEANLSRAQEKLLMSVKITPGKDATFFNGSLCLSPEKHIPTKIGHRIVNSGRPFVDSAGFSFPVLSVRDFPEELPMESLEVFRPSEELAAALRKKEEKPLPGEGALRRSFTYPTSPIADDAASDTSSDLFEIESLSTVYRRRDSLDELEARRFVGSDAAAGVLLFRRSLDDEAVAAGVSTPSIAPSECYPPSEVSVQWSVVTAKGFDRDSVANFSSAASDYDEFATVMGGGDGRRKSSGLLGCRSEKAINLGPIPVRFIPPIEPEPSSHAAKLARENLARMYLSVQSR